MPIDLSKYKIKNLKNKITYQGRPLTILEFNKANNKYISRNKMMEICNKLVRDLRAKHGDGIVSVSIKYPERWYSGDVSQLSEPVNYFTANDYDEFDEDPEQYTAFRFHFIPTPPPAGGADQNNDCVINCIKKVIQSFRNNIDPAELKKRLGLERSDLVPVDQMHQVEQYIYDVTNQQYAIYVTGDHEYTSGLNTPKQIHLILSNKHYKLNNDKFIKSKLISHKEKPILMFEFQGSDIVTYDGDEIGTISREEYDENRKNVITAPYILVKKDFCASFKNMCIEEAYEAYIKMANDMKSKTFDKINFLKCRSLKQMALNHFFTLNQSIQPDQIDNSEASFIDNASFKALTYWERYQGKVHSYDINSHYPSVMIKNYHYFPIKKGEYKTIKTEEIDVKNYGLYRCKITGSHKFFQSNDKNYYTHLDIQSAQQLGFKVEMVQDGQPNFLYWSKEKLMNGAFLFKKYVDQFYQLKQDGVQGSKDLLNILWGALCEASSFKAVGDSGKEITIKDARITALKSDSHIRVTFVSYDKKYFKTNYARIKPFVLAYGRRAIFCRYHHLAPYVVRIHTDGFYLTTQPDGIVLGEKIGHLKYEVKKSTQVNITSLNKK